MLNETIRTIRKSKGLSQEELAARLNVVRQTVSKWEQGLSVPDADLLIALSAALETPVNILLGETAATEPAGDFSAIAEKLERLNRQFAEQTRAKRKFLCGLLIALSAGIAALSVFFLAFQSQYLNWNYADPETAVAGTVLHAFEFLFVRLAPILFAGTVAGSILTGRKLLRSRL